jgi:hypothetical protein
MTSLTTARQSEGLSPPLEEALANTPLRRGEGMADRAAQPWRTWPGGLIERLPLPYWLVVLLLGASAVGEQVLEISLVDPTFARATSLVGTGLVFPALVIYILTHLHILRKASIDALTNLRPSVQVSDNVYEAHARRLVRGNPWVETALLGVALGVVLLLFLGMHSDLLSYDGGLPAATLAAAFIVLNYTLLGWLILRVVYIAIRQALALHALARQPLEVNVFDPGNLLPFGRLSLIQSLPVVALILIPLVLIGPPTQAGYMVILLSVVSVLSLFMPLWGVHRQIDHAKEQALDNIYRRLLIIQGNLLGVEDLDPQTIDNMSDRTAMLIKLRELIQQSPNWPFKDSAAVMRAIVAVSSPLVYFILNALIGAYVLPLLTSGAP